MLSLHLILEMGHYFFIFFSVIAASLIFKSLLVFGTVKKLAILIRACIRNFSKILPESTPEILILDSSAGY